MISVAMATYNGQDYIKEQLISILNQNKKVDEIVICDDCSTDNTINIIKTIKNKFENFNMRLFVNEKNMGYKINFKQALSYCRGEYIFLCDQDDIWLPNKVEKMIGIMELNKNIKVLASSYELIDSKGDITKSNISLYRHNVKQNTLKKISFEELVVGNSFQGCSLCIRSEINDKFQNHFNEYFHHDWLLNIYASEVDGMYFYNEALFQYRIHGNNVIGLSGLAPVTYDVKSLEGRLKTAKDSLDNLIHLECIDEDVYRNVSDFNKYKQFYVNHISNIENGCFIKLLISNFNPYYSLIKSFKGRIMDVMVCLKVFIKKI